MNKRNFDILLIVVFMALVFIVFGYFLIFAA